MNIKYIFNSMLSRNTYRYKQVYHRPFAFIKYFTILLEVKYQGASNQPHVDLNCSLQQLRATCGYLNLNSLILNKGKMQFVPQSHEPHFKCSTATWLMDALLDSPDTEHFHHCRKLCLTVINDKFKALKRLSNLPNSQEVAQAGFKLFNILTVDTCQVCMYHKATRLG